VADFFDRAVNITLELKKSTKTLKDFKALFENGIENFPDLVSLKNDVTTFARKFPTIGF
jgi:hypothetical protein